jgi:acetyl/propionyl-CoA carboxylase alpha subunit
VKASAGGGGKGMRVVHGPEQLAQSLEMARSEAQKAFGDGTLLLERYFTSVKHIEVQIFGDSHGRQVHLFERECSIQRRHQKIIEESPSPSLSPEQRERICNSALALARHINYVNAGTVEFILDEKGDFYFLEVNTRLQVEHPVTEMVTGLNLVEMQVRVAEGAQLADLLPQEVQQQGHAIECRIYAEDPSKNYLPSSGKILAYEEADVASTTDPVEFRYDSGIYHHLEVTPFYDPMLAKVTAHARTRDKALHDMDRILAETLLLGVRTNMAQLRDIVKHPHFVDASFDTHFLDTYGQSLPSMHGLPTEAVALATGMYLGINTRRAFGSLTGWAPIGMAPIALVAKHCGRPVSVSFRYEGSDFMVQVDGHTHRFEPDAYDSGKVDGDVSAEYQTKVGNTVLLLAQGYNHDVEFEPLLTYATATAQRGGCTAPMPGEVVRIMIKEGDTVKAGQPMLILSAMKMENTIEAPADGRVEAVLVKEKDQVKADQTLVTLGDSESK